MAPKGGGGARRYDDLDNDFEIKLPESTWRNLGWKTRQIWPFLWPKGHFWLQLRICFCVGLLLVARGINVIVPFLNKVKIYSKYF